MARKNIFGADPEPASPADAVASEDLRPLANLDRPLRRSGAVGAFSQSLGSLSEKAQRVAALEEKLAHAQAVVDLDPVLIDSSFVPDRLDAGQAGLEGLAAQIRDHGQQVPILVRPHPEMPGRYQVAYGHRRLAAIRKLGGTVKAVVRPLTDEQLVVSQGQENNARTDLSYVERSFFALRLERRGFARDIIMSALGVDKAALSRMIALAARLPDALIEAIGPAPGFGRTRWAELADLLESEGKKKAALAVISQDIFREKSTDERFELIFERLRQAKPKPRSALWKAGERKAVKIMETDSHLTLSFDKQSVPAFGPYVEAHLGALYEAFLKENEESKP